MAFGGSGEENCAALIPHCGKPDEQHGNAVSARALLPHHRALHVLAAASTSALAEAYAWADCVWMPMAGGVMGRVHVWLSPLLRSQWRRSISSRRRQGEGAGTA